MRSSTAMFLSLTLVAACSDKGEDSGFVGGGGSLIDDTGGEHSGTDDTAGGDDTADTGIEDPLQQACESGETGEATTQAAVRLTSAVSWALTFDEEAEVNGFTDCVYSRDFEGVQVLEYDYLCPECDFIVVGTATMTEGLKDCYVPVFGEADESRTEVWGISGSTLYRTGNEQYPLGELAEFDGTSGDGVSIDVTWESEYEMTDGGMMTLAASGTMAWETDEDTRLEDPWAPREDVYACGWECNDPGTLELDYDLAVGSTFPNVRLDDQCGDTVDLWDFYGSYLVIDSSQSDCGPCRTMASEEHEFLDQMREEGIPVRVLTMMGNGLSDPIGTPDEATVASWVETYGVTDPVFQDKGFTYALFPDFIEEYSGEDYGFPVWVVVDPEMKLIHGNVGFSSWDDVADVIYEDME